MSLESDAVLATLKNVPRTATWETKTVEGRLVYNVRRLTGLVHDMYPTYTHVFLWTHWGEREARERVACVRGSSNGVNEVVWVDEATLTAALALDGLYNTGASERAIFGSAPLRATPIHASRSRV